MATIREIANELGVSLSTVSAVVNKRGYVSSGMREKVEHALLAASYQPNQIARSLRRKESRTIGFIVPDLANSFYSYLLRGAEDYLASMDYRLIVADSREDWKRQQDYLVAFTGKVTDGILLVPCLATDEQIEMIPAVVGPTPLVYVDRSPHRAPFDCVLIDNAQACFEATRHLIGLGHQRIAIITEPLNLLSAVERLQGYRRALRSKKVRPDPRLIRTGDNKKESGYWVGLDLLRMEDAPRAFVVCNNLMTLGLLTATKESGLECPREVSVVGFDDCDWSEHLDPPLTTVTQPAAEMGATAAKMLLKRLRQPKLSPPVKTLLPVRLTVRGSTTSPNCSPPYSPRGFKHPLS
jgi:LacI family transcriptional regulator